MLLANIDLADILVLASPVYVDGITGPMKTLLDRMIPCIHPFIELQKGHCRHPVRSDKQGKKMVLVASCGFWERDNFDPLLVHLTAASKNLGLEFAGALLRPQGSALKFMSKSGMGVDDIFAQAQEAGRQMIKEGKMALETLKIISRDLMPLEKYCELLNNSFKEMLERIDSV